MTRIVNHVNHQSKMRVNRRQFMKKMVAAGLVSSMPCGMLMAPGSAAAAPKKGGHLRMGIGFGSTADSLDPATIKNPFAGNVHMALHNALVEIDENGVLKPEIAESWDISKDCKTWAFQIRKGITFHNGATLTAADVLASINHHRGENSKSAARALLKAVVDLKADGKYMVVFQLNRPNADFGYIMSDVHLQILPANGDGIDWQSGIGAGPYRLEKFEPGVLAKFKRNPDYWKNDRAHFDSVEMIVVLDQTARENALRSGGIDIINGLNLRTAHLLKQIPNIKIAEVTGLGHYSLPMLTDVAPFDDNNVRLALKHGINRETLLKSVFYGHGGLGNDQPIGPGYKYYDKTIPQRKYDPDKAMFYLNKAGIGDLTVKLHTSEAPFPQAVDTAMLYKENAKKAGINIEIVNEPKDGYWSNVWRKKPFCFCSWKGRPTEDWMFTSAYGEGSSYNDSNWKHKRFNELLTQARSELDESKRRAMYSKMQRLVRDEGGVVIPIFANYMMAYHKKLNHGPLLRYADLDGYKLAERWWIA